MILMIGGAACIFGLAWITSLFLSSEEQTNSGLIIYRGGKIVHRPLTAKTIKTGQNLSLLAYWPALSKIPGGSALCNLGLRVLFPFAFTAGMKIVEFVPGRTVLTMKNRWRVRDFDGTVDAAAALGLAKICSSMSVASVCGTGVEPKFLGFSYKVEGPCKKTIRAECISFAPVSHEHETLVVLTNLDGSVCGKVLIFWGLSKV